MPHVELLIRLLRVIAESGESAENLTELEELLRKVAKTNDPVRIEVDYNGREFHWKIPQHNITAEKWEQNKRGREPDRR